jgi:hypothetical protein
MRAEFGPVYQLLGARDSALLTHLDDLDAVFGRILCDGRPLARETIAMRSLRVWYLGTRFDVDPMSVELEASKASDPRAQVCPGQRTPASRSQPLQQPV